MTPIELVGGLCVLVATASVGIVAHELAHAVTLHAFGIPYRTDWLPGDRSGLPGGGAMGGLASVTPVSVPPGLAPWRLRVASMMPLALATPFVLVAVGVVPDPFAVGGVYHQLAAIAWLACALPSPQDFSLFWHADRALPDR